MTQKVGENREHDTRRQKAHVKAFYRSLLYAIGPQIPQNSQTWWKTLDCLYEGKDARAFIFQQPSLIGWFVSQET